MQSYSQYWIQLNIFCNGAVWGSVTIISSRAVTCMLTIYILGETRPPRVCMRALPRHHRSRRTQTALIACGAALTLLLQLLTSSQLESNLNSWSNRLLFAPMSSGAVHRRYACMPAATAAAALRRRELFRAVTKVVTLRGGGSCFNPETGVTARYNNTFWGNSTRHRLERLRFLKKLKLELWN